MNSKSFLKFTIGLLQFVVIMAVIAAYPLYKFVPQRLLFALGESLLFFVCLTLLIFGFIVRRAKKGNEILNGYFLSIAIKMFIGLIYFVVILQDYKDLALGFTICFFSAYFLCTSFEVYYLMTNLRQISDTPKNADI